MNPGKTRNRFIPGVPGACRGRDAACRHRRHYVHSVFETQCRAAYAYREEKLVDIGFTE